jgi:bacterioferritin-associated ferredoxin
MYICICNAITDKQIRRAAKAGVTSMSALQAELGVATGCGSCRDAASSILSECQRRSAPRPRPRLFVPVPA